MNDTADDQSSKIAVDLRYRDLVINYLKGFHPDDPLPAATPDEANKVLDIGLIKLRDEVGTAGKVMAKWEAQIPIKPQPSDDTELLPVDKILDGLRLEIGSKRGGWYPRMGKVREADLVGGLPHIGAGQKYPAAREPSAFLSSATSAVGAGVLVGVIDSPMYPHHPELIGRWHTPTGFFSVWDDPAVYPWLRGHSAFVAGRILQRAPGARLEVRGVLEGDTPRSSVWTVATAMTDALESGIKLLNLSLGCYTRDGQPPFVLARAVEVLSTKGVVCVAAAGNHGEGNGSVKPNAPIFPAACPGAIAVGAFENIAPYKPASLTPEGPWIALGAPGEDVESTYLRGTVELTKLPGLGDPPKPKEDFSGYATWSGTSFATGTVTGEIARIMTERKIDVQDAVSKLLDTDPNRNNGIGRYPAA